jgi:hypothetical protein
MTLTQLLSLSLHFATPWIPCVWSSIVVLNIASSSFGFAIRAIYYTNTTCQHRHGHNLLGSQAKAKASAVVGVAALYVQYPTDEVTERQLRRCGSGETF